MPGHRKPFVTSPRDCCARVAVPRRLSKWHRSFLDGDILLKWTPYSQERLGAVLLFAQNSKVPVISFESTLVLYCFVVRTAGRLAKHRRSAVESSTHVRNARLRVGGVARIQCAGHRRAGASPVTLAHRCRTRAPERSPRPWMSDRNPASHLTGRMVPFGSRLPDSNGQKRQKRQKEQIGVS